MIITYKQWQTEVNKIKSDNGFLYLTKKKCKQQYGWSWSMVKPYKLSASPFVVKVTFHNESAESFYRLKWA